MAVKVLHCYTVLFVYVTFLVNMHAYLYDCVGPSRNNQSVPRLFRRASFQLSIVHCLTMSCPTDNIIDE